MCLAIIPHKETIVTVVNPGEGPRGSTPLIFRPNWGPKDRKNNFGDPPFLRVWMTPHPPPPPPPYLKVWIRHCIKPRAKQGYILSEFASHVTPTRITKQSVIFILICKYLSLSIGLGECSYLATREHVTNHHKPAWLFERPFRGQEMLLVINFEDRSTFNRMRMWFKKPPPG